MSYPNFYFSDKYNNANNHSLFLGHKPSFHRLKAGMSVEAALALPVFIYACMAIVSVITFYGTYVKVESALYNTGMKLAKYEYVYEVAKSKTDLNLEKLEESNIVSKIIGQGIEIVTVKAMVIDELGKDFVDKSCIFNGVWGMNFMASELLNEDGVIDIILTYKLENPFDIFHLSKVPITQRVRVRAYKGDYSILKQKDEKEEEYVYITETGKVYHLSSTCTYIKLDIQKVSHEDISKLRNDSGAKYYICEKCGGGTRDVNVVYITKYGTRYHKDINCSELKRGVLKVKLEMVQDRKPCSKCGEGK